MQLPLLHRYTQLMMLKKQIKRKARRLKKYKRVARARWRKIRQIRFELLEELRQVMSSQQKNDAELKRVQARHALDGILVVYKRWLRRWTKTLRMQRKQLREQQKQEDNWDLRLSKLKMKLGQQPNHKKLVDKCFSKLRKALKDWLNSPDRDPSIEATVHTWEMEVEAIRRYLMDLDWQQRSSSRRRGKRKGKLGISGFSLFWDMEMQGKKSKWLPLTVSPKSSALVKQKSTELQTTRKRKKKTQKQHVKTKSDLTMKYDKKAKTIKKYPSIEDLENLFKELIVDDKSEKVVPPQELKKLKKKKLKKKKRKRNVKSRKLSQKLELLDMLNLDKPLEDHQITIKRFLQPKKPKVSKIKAINRREILEERKSLGPRSSSKSKEIKFSDIRHSREIAKSSESDKEQTKRQIAEKPKLETIEKTTEKSALSFVEKFKLNELPHFNRPMTKRKSRKMSIKKLPEATEDDLGDGELSDEVVSYLPEELGFNEEETKYLKDLEANRILAKKSKRPGQAVPISGKGKRIKARHGRGSLKPPTPEDFESIFDQLEMASSEVSLREKKMKISKLRKELQRKLSRHSSKSTIGSLNTIESQAIGDGPQSKRITLAEKTEFPNLPDRKGEIVKIEVKDEDARLNPRVAYDDNSMHVLETANNKVTFRLEDMNSQEKYKPLQHFLKETIEQNSILRAVPDSKALMRVVESHHMWKNLNGLHDEMEAAGFSSEDMLAILKEKYIQYLKQIVGENQGDVVTIREQEVIRLSGKTKPKAKFDAGLHLRDLKPLLRPWGRTPGSDLLTVDQRPRAISVANVTKLKSPRMSEWVARVISETDSEKTHEVFDTIVSQNIDATVEDLAQLDAYVKRQQPVESSFWTNFKERDIEIQLTQSQLEHEERIQKLLNANYLDTDSNGSFFSISLDVRGMEQPNLYNVEQRYSPRNLREVMTRYKQYFQSRSKSPFLLELERKRRQRQQHLKASKMGFKVSKGKAKAIAWRRCLRKPQKLRSTQNLYYAPRTTCRATLSSSDNEECSECGQRLDQEVQKPCTWKKCPRCGIEVTISSILSAGSIEACAKNKLIRSFAKDICLRCGYVHSSGSPCPQLACLAKPHPMTQLQRIQAAAKNHSQQEGRLSKKEAPKFCSPCGILKKKKQWIDIWRNSSFSASAASLSSSLGQR